MTYVIAEDEWVCTDGCCVWGRDTELVNPVMRWFWENRNHGTEEQRPPGVGTPRPMYQVLHDDGGSGYDHGPWDYTRMEGRLAPSDLPPIYL